MKTKTLFLGSFLALVLSVGTFSGIKSNSAIVKADTTSDLGTFSPGSVNGGNGNGFYISMKAENDLPFDAGWSYLSVNTTQKCYLNSQACSVNLKKLDVNNYYVCLSDAGVSGQNDGDIFILDGNYSYTHVATSTVYTFNVTKTRYKFNGTKWAKDVFFEDSELEVYDKITLKDTGIPDTDSSVSRDYQGHGFGSVNSFSASEGNTTGSQVLSFVYSSSETKNNSTFDFRLRGLTQNWNGYRFQFCNSWGPTGVAIAKKDDTTKYSGDIPMNLANVKDTVIELGAIDVKDTDLTWIFVKQDGAFLFSDVVETVAGWTYPTAGFYVPGEGTDSLQTFKSVNQEYANLINSGEATINVKNSTKNGVYLDITADDGVPYFADWSKSSVILNTADVTINGKSIYNYGSACLKKYGPTQYYLIFSDFGFAAQTNDVLIIEGAFGYWDADSAHKYTFKFAPLAAKFDGTAWAVIPDFLNTLGNNADEDIDYDMYNETGLQELDGILQVRVPLIKNASSYNEGLKLFLETKALLNEVEQDPAYAAAKLAQAKEEAIATLEAYAVEDNYSEENWTTVQGLVETGKTNINACSKVSEVKTALETAKDEIDKVETIQQQVERIVKNRESGYEEHLVTYDVASLSSFNFSEMKFQAYVSPTDPSTISTDAGTTQFNTCRISEENTTGSLIYQFTYNINTLENGKYGGIFIRLRGIQYFGYRFDLATNNGGYNIFRYESDANYKKVATGSNVFSVNTDYNVQLGSIDLAEYNRVWLFLTVDGQFVASEITDKIDFCKNPRVGIMDSYMKEGTTDVALFKDWNQGVTTSASDIEIGRMRPFENSNDGSIGTYLTSEDDVAYSENWDLYSYPTSKDSLKLNGEAIADPHTSALQKFSPTQYYLNLSNFGVTAVDGDELVIEGGFCYMDPTTSKKVNFSVKKSTMVYHAPSEGHQNGYWEYILDIEEVKQDAITEINNFVNLDDYSSTNKAQVESIIKDAETAINAAESKDEVETILFEAKVAIAVIPTILTELKATAIQALEEAVSEILDQYRPAQQKELNDIVEAGEIAIALCEDEEELLECIAVIEAEMSKVKTDAQLKEEELKAAKSAAKDEIVKFYGTLDLTNYSEENINKINELVLAAKSAIDNETKIENLEKIVSDLKTAIGQIEKKQAEKKGGCGGSIIAASSALAIISLCGICLMASKRKED